MAGSSWWTEPYVPTGNHAQTGRSNYSGRRHCQGLNVQLAATTDRHLLAVSAPSPGAFHDSHALANVGWINTLTNRRWIADRAYIGTGAFTPHKKPLHRALNEAETECNAIIAKLRAPVERRISHLKNWRILSHGYRGQLKHLSTIIVIVTTLEIYRTYE